MTTPRSLHLAVAAFLIGGSYAGAQQDSTAGGRGGAGGQNADPHPRPYAQVVTAQAKSRDGLFKTHRIGSRVLFEIPRTALNKDMLLVTRTSRTPLNAGYGGMQVGQRRVLRWERREHRVLARTVSYETVGDSTSPFYSAI